MTNTQHEAIQTLLALAQRLPGAATDAATVHLGALRNIATFHREHERYYTLAGTEAAADLYREANRLRVVADVWLRAAAPRPLADVDFALPLYAVAGCVDLSDPATV